MESGWRRIGGLLALSVTLGACVQKHPASAGANAGPESAEHGARVTTSAAPATSAAAAASAAPALCHGFPVALPPPSPALHAYFAEQPEVFEWQKLYLFHPQPPPKGFKGLGARLNGAFPGRGFRRVLFHHFGADRVFPGTPALDSGVPGCKDDLLAADGRYCPSVSYPPVELSEAQVTELLRMTNEREANPKIVASGWQKDCGFVFVNDAGTPVAEILIGMYSRKVVTRPTNDVLSTGDWGHERVARLRALVDELEPQLFKSPEQWRKITEQSQKDEQAAPSVPPFLKVSLARVLPAYSSVEPELREADLSDEQRARACAWQQLVWLQGAPRSGPDANTIECEDGWKVSGRDLLSCEREFPRCEATLGEVETCMRHQRFDPCFAQPAARHCVALRGCLWGISSSTAQ